jgi:hypothetical protein
VLTSPEGDERASADGSNMENSFEPGGIFYRLLRADSTRWVSKGAGFLEPFGAEEPSLADLKDEVEELRHRLAESQRSTSSLRSAKDGSSAPKGSRKPAPFETQRVESARSSR